MEVRTYRGTCQEHEICVNGPGQEGNWSTGNAIQAFCVAANAFTAEAGVEPTDLSGTTVTSLLTSTDMQRPFTGARIDVEAESRTSDGEEKVVSSKDCEKCVSLTTEKLPSNTTSFLLSETWIMGKEMIASSVIGLILMMIIAH